ncbi:MAG: preprotein translocase subunit SecG [Mycoplasmataceae bacterium]|jgi:preprotein translocase subunit SecG|nr:preprotein translocase subunit SecG [Mycoplasmataceae bacterium]
MDNPIIIALIIIAIVAIVIGLMLSGSGSTTGLTAISGQDLELFKKTKDRGLVKVLQMVMFFLLITALLLSMVYVFIY